MNAYYLVTVLFLLLSSRANMLYENDLCWAVLDVIFILIAINKNRFKKGDLKPFLSVSLFYVALIFIRNQINHLGSDFIVSDLLYLFKFVLFSYLYVLTVKDKAVFYIVSVLSKLAYISIILYFLQILSGGGIFLTIGKLLEKITFNKNINPNFTNFFVYSYNVRHSIRNSGFSWEPGAFGCFLILGILFNFFQNGFKIDRTTKIFFIALVTTLSTTAYFALFMIMILYYRVRGGRFNIGLVLGLIVIILIVLNVPFLGDKIINVYNNDSGDVTELDKLSSFYDDSGKSIPLNRFASILFISLTFGFKLILGISNKYSELYTSKYNINLSNGIVDFVAKFGLVGLVFLFSRFAKFCKIVLKKSEFVAYCVLILVIISFGEPILILPISLMFIFLPHFNKNGLYSYSGI